jgi:hypothetical protein
VQNWSFYLDLSFLIKSLITWEWIAVKKLRF